MPQEFAYQNSFKAEILNGTYKTLNDTVIETSIPGLEIGTTPYSTGIKDLILPGESKTIQNLTLNFVADEDMTNWLSVFSWLNSLSNFHTVLNNPDLLTDIAIHMLNNKLNSSSIIQLEDCFPFSISNIEFTSQIADTEPMTFSVEFIVNNIIVE